MNSQSKTTVSLEEVTTRLDVLLRACVRSERAAKLAVYNYCFMHEAQIAALGWTVPEMIRERCSVAGCWMRLWLGYDSWRTVKLALPDQDVDPRVAVFITQTAAPADVENLARHVVIAKAETRAQVHRVAKEAGIQVMPRKSKETALIKYARRIEEVAKRLRASGVREELLAIVKEMRGGTR